jgi:hypothetical protein
MLADPPPPPELRALGIRAGETRTIDTESVWWRVHRTQGDHVLAWNALRTFAATPDAALAEAFQVDRTIDRELGRPYLTGVSLARALTVLDLAADSRGAWATRAGGNFAISTAPHAVSQRWARHIVEAFPDLDGLRYNSRFSGHVCLALFTPAQSAMPTRPVLSLPLSHPGLAGRIAGAARRLGYGIV